MATSSRVGIHGSAWIVRGLILLFTVAALGISVGPIRAGLPAQATAPGLRLYILDLGALILTGAPKDDPNAESPMPAYFIVHPKGSLLFEAGGIPDDLVALNFQTVTR